MPQDANSKDITGSLDVRDSAYSSPDHLAAAVILHDLDKDEIEKRFQQGFSAEAEHFAYQYGQSLSEYAVSKIIEDGNKLEESCARWAKGIMFLSDRQTFTSALDTLQTKLALRCEEMTRMFNNQRELNLDTRIRLAQILAKNPNYNNAHREDISDTLSYMAKYATDQPPAAQPIAPPAPPKPSRPRC